MEGDAPTAQSQELTTPDSPISSNWPSLPISSSNDTIPPGQKTPGIASWKAALKEPEDFKKDSVGKYAKYFKGNEILPIPEIAKNIELRILSLVVTDLKTKRVTGLKKEAFKELQTAGIPYQYFSRRNYVTWDILLPTVEQVARTATTNIMTKYFHLQLENMGTRRFRVTICNVLVFLTGEVLASFQSAYGRVEEVFQLRSANGTAFGDYTFKICLTREGFQAIPESIISWDKQMMVIVEDRTLHCWNCKQFGHIDKFCPQKELTSTTVTLSQPSKEAEKEKPAPAQKLNEEGWTEVTRRKKKDSPKEPVSTPKTPATQEPTALVPVPTTKNQHYAKRRNHKKKKQLHPQKPNHQYHAKLQHQHHTKSQHQLPNHPRKPKTSHRKKLQWRQHWTSRGEEATKRDF